MELKFDPDNPNYEYITDYDHAEKVLTLLDDEPIIGVDIESTGLDGYTSKLLMVQLGTDTISYIFDARALDLKSIEHFKTLLEDPKKIKLLHNAKFDYKYIRIQTGIKINNIYDTMLAEGVLTAGLTSGFNSLKKLSVEYAGVQLDKNVRKEFVGLENAEFTEDQLQYGAIDTLVLFPIFEQQIRKLKKENLLKIAKLEFATTSVVGEMEIVGVFLNEEKWKKILEVLAKRRDELANEFYAKIRPLYPSSQLDLFGGEAPPININSNVQLLDLFNEKLNLDMPSTGIAELKKVKHPVVQLLAEYRGYEKLLSSFGDSLLSKINPVTKRIHPEFNQLGAATGRFSCNKPNLQQIPRNSDEAPFRECFNPKPGYKFVVADYSSMEMRILADLSGDERMIKALREGLDLHSYTASLMFGKPYSDDFKKKYPELRQIAKPIGFGLMYGMGAVGLAGRLGVSKEEGQDYMDKYFSSYPSVQKFLDNMANNAIKKGWSATPAGRKRWYRRPDRTDPEYRRQISSIQRAAKNHPIQGTNADAIKYALVYVYERMQKDKIDGDIIMTIHDEIVCEVREDQADAFADVLSEEMIRAGALFIKKVPIKSDPFVGEVWEH